MDENNSPTSPDSKKTPIYKKWWIWAIVAALAIIGAVGGSHPDTSPTPAPQSTAAKSPKESGSPSMSASSTPAKIDVKTLADEVDGENALTAIDRLDKGGVLGSVAAANGTEMDRERLESDKRSGVEWIVTESKAKVLSGKVDLVVDTQSNVLREEQEAADYKALSVKLSPSNAVGACNRYGQSKYPYGFRPHGITGVLQDATPRGDSWFYKATADVTNEYGAAREMTYECSVTGTDADPRVTEFNVY